MNITVILGTRPEAVKLAPVIHALKDAESINCHVCVTAQHREMLDQVLDAFGIVADTDLDLMRPHQTLAEFTCRALSSLDRHFESLRPDFVLYQGDTTTVLAGALAAFYRGVPIGHVEAGLRTGNLLSPWPEEANRVLTTKLATLHFAPTETNRQNLLREGVSPERIILTGNTVIDALLLAVERVRLNPPEIPGLNAALLKRTGSPVVLITGHRRESFGEKFDSICHAIADLAKRFPQVQFIYPVHRNPAVRASVDKTLRMENGQGPVLPNVHLIEPLPYFEFVALMDRASILLTDSGGIQEEAPSLGKPVVVMRDNTERPEAVQLGCAKLVGTERHRIVDEVSRLLTDESYYLTFRKENPYGDGKAAKRIVDAITRYLTPGDSKQEKACVQEAAKSTSRPAASSRVALDGAR